MDLKVEIVLSTSIKRKKPWPQFCWLGQEKESVFLLDERRISELNMVTGRTKRKIPKLQIFLQSVLTMNASHNGMWLCGLLASGQLFLWNKDKDLLKMGAGVLDEIELVSLAQEKCTKLFLQVSDDGMRALLVAKTGEVFLWQCVDPKDLASSRDGLVQGQWEFIRPCKEIKLPLPEDKEAFLHTIFIKTEIMGDSCLSAFVFTSGNDLLITLLKIQWNDFSVSSRGFSVQWATKDYPLFHLTPPCRPVKSRGSLVPCLSPDGKLLAVVLNQKDPKATQVLFMSTQNFVTISTGLGGCGCKMADIPSKYIRSYWVGSVSWSPGGLFFACVLKRGSLFILARLGGLLTLVNSGLNCPPASAHFLPLHPLIIVWHPTSAENASASWSGSSMSAQDVLRQRYSVTWHPRLFYFIVSDGYIATTLRLPEKPSPALLLRSILNGTCKELEKVTINLEKTQDNIKAWLESVSCLNLDSSLKADEISSAVGCQDNTTDSLFLTGTPPFLKDQWKLSGAVELIDNMQALFEDDSDLDGIPISSHMEDRGHLEFASMYDTMHARDAHHGRLVTSSARDGANSETEKKIPLHHELQKIQNDLLMAWALCLSLGNSVEHKTHLLKHILRCALRLAALFHLTSCSVVREKEENDSTSAGFTHLVKALMSFLPWDGSSSHGAQCLKLLVEFSHTIVALSLSPHSFSCPNASCRLSSQSLSRALDILQIVSDSLDQAYSLKLKTVCSSEEDSPSQPPSIWSSDVYHSPILLTDTKDNTTFKHHSPPVPQRPSSRLLKIWQLIYDVGLNYAEELEQLRGCDGWEEEKQKLSVIISQVQIALQAAGERLGKDPALLSYPGEDLFLSGSFSESADTVQLQISEEAGKSCASSVVQETRFCLSLLFNLLSQYRLRESQELGDHMARLILSRAGHAKDVPDSSQFAWLSAGFQSDAAYAVVQTLGRFMASYFTNQPLFILPAHNVSILAPLHLPQAPGIQRLMPLNQEEMARAVRQQHLSELWTVDYALDLLLLGGLLPEAVWLAYHLGDWKTAVSLSLTYTIYCKERSDFNWLRRPEFELTTSLKPESIFQAELECLILNKENTDEDVIRSFADPLEGGDRLLLQTSIQEILKASVIAGVNVMSFPMSSLLGKAKTICSYLPALVPKELYLPSPPLYCPQPSPNTQDQIKATLHLAEVERRCQVSEILQRLILLLKSGCCCHPAALWYITHLNRARHILFKMKKKYNYPSAPQEEKPFPEDLAKFITRGGYFRLGPKKDGRVDRDIIDTIVCFRELCALCWMLHVRDQLTLHCRRYQAARQQTKDEQHSDVTQFCASAVSWVCRLLPFARFLNAEELLQDVLLSLINELPSTSMVAEILTRFFPEAENSVRVSLREKYNLLRERLNLCRVLEGEKNELGEMMPDVIRRKLRRRRKHLLRLNLHVGPTVLHLWEKEEKEEEDKASKEEAAQLKSPSSSANSSILTSSQLQPLSGSGDPAENTTDSDERRSRIEDLQSKKSKKENANKMESAAEQKNNADNENKERPSIPVVGTWEFELEDDEYLNFLGLFLSYVVEKNDSDGHDYARELPLLKSFSSKLRKKELDSLKCDALDPVHHRGDGQCPDKKHAAFVPPVFRAGFCYKFINDNQSPEQQLYSVSDEGATSSVYEQNAKNQKGLFSLQQQNIRLPSEVKEADTTSDIRPVQSGITTSRHSDSFFPGSSVQVQIATQLQQSLDPKLEAQFPELARLLEWVVRWADRTVLRWHLGAKKKPTVKADERVVIRIKASAPAILTSLSLLEWKHAFAFLPGNNSPSSYIQVPEMQRIASISPVLLSETLESSRKTVGSESTLTSISCLSRSLQVGDFSSDFETEKAEVLTFERSFSPAEQIQTTSDAAQSRKASKLLTLGDLDVSSGKDDRTSFSDSFEDYSSDTIASVPVSATEASLKLADLDKTKEDNIMAISPPVEHPEPPATPAEQPELNVNVEHPEPERVQLPYITVDPPVSEAPNLANAAPTAEATIPPDQSDVTSLMRQRLGEDLLRLVQQIHYVSLGDIIGSTFANLQQFQQNSFLPTQDLRVPSTPRDNLVPKPNVPPAQTTVSPAPQTHSSVPNTESSRSPASETRSNRSTVLKSTETPSATDQCQSIESLLSDRPRFHYKEMQVLSPEVLPKTQKEKSSGSSSPSQGQLISRESVYEVSSSSELVIDRGISENSSAREVPRLKLLKLDRHLSLQCPPAQLPTGKPEPPGTRQQMPKSDDQAASKQKKEQSDVFSAPKIQLDYNPSQHPTSGNSQYPISHSGRSDNQRFLLLPTAFPAHTPMQGLRLLRIPNPTIILPQIPTTTYARYDFFSAPVTEPQMIKFLPAPVTEPQMIKLLHIEPEPKLMLPQKVPSTKDSLFSMARFPSSGISRYHAGDPGVLPERLKEDPTEESTKESATSNSRQKRRIEKEKANATLKPNKPKQTTEKSLNESEVTERLTPTQDVKGNPYSLLTGQTLLDKVYTTSAELHAFASTRKKPPECRDASTITDPVCIFYQTGKIEEGKSQGARGKAKDTAQTSRVTQINPEDTSKNQESCGRQFIRVFDLEISPEPDDWQPSQRSDATEAPSIRPPAPTSAELHLLATSVIRSSAEKIPEGQPKPTTSADIPVIVSNQKPSEVSAAIKPPENMSAFDLKLRRALKDESSLPDKAVSFSSHLSKLDVQLTSLQKFADNLEKDYSECGLPVNLINGAPLDSSPTLKIKKKVRLSVPLKAWSKRSNHGLSSDSMAYGEGDDSMRISKKKSSHSSRYRGRNSSEFEDYFAEVYGISPDWTDQDLGQSELSDTTEILDDLVREGYLSPTDWKIPASKTTQNPRQQSLPRNVWMPHNDRSVDERRDLRIWMRRRQQEQLATYHKHRQALRRKESRPFPLSPTKSSNRPRNTFEQLKEKKLTLLENYDQRTMEACSLAIDLATPLPSFLPVRSSSAPIMRSGQRAVHVKSEQVQTNPKPVAVPPKDLEKRLGLNRPVTYLPADRLSQVTKRGMLTTNQRQVKVPLVDQFNNKNAGSWRKKESNGNFSGAGAARKVIPNNNNGSKPDVPALSRRLERLDLASGSHSKDQSDVVLDSIPESDWLDDITNSADSNFSKIDWAAIEKIVAGEENRTD